MFSILSQRHRVTKMRGQTMIDRSECLLNTSLPYTMHIDLNSCFAIIEQQANRLLRGRPVGIAAYDTPRGFVLAASYEAKAKGVKLGVNVQQARQLCPDIVIMTPDPAKYREAHRLFKSVLLEYTPDVVPKSIDEFVVDFTNSIILKTRIKNLSHHIPNFPRPSLGKLEIVHNIAIHEIAMEIKEKIRERLGEWVTVNIGIGTNRFLAKYAAGFDKPDGMTLIDHNNLRERFENMKLVDLPGINTRYRARLRAHGIYTPLQFLDAELDVLQKRVFKSVVGYYWYLRLRGHEIDAAEFSRRSIGHQYALSEKTTDKQKLAQLLLKLCEKTGRRLRRNNYYATGIHLYLGFEQYRDLYKPSQEESMSTARDAQRPISEALLGHEQSSQEVGPASFENMANIRSWHHGEKVLHRLYSTQDIYEAAKRLLWQAEIYGKVKILSVHVYGLEPWDPQQLSIFDMPSLEKTNNLCQQTLHGERQVDAMKRVSDAVDAINNRYGEFVLTPAAMLDMQGTILDRIAFGQVRDI